MDAKRDLKLGNFNGNPSMRALAKILRAGASDHSSNFCKQLEQRPNFVSTFKFNGTVRFPYNWLAFSRSRLVFIFSPLNFFQLLLSTARVNRYFGRLHIDFVLPSIKFTIFDLLTTFVNMFLQLIGFLPQRERPTKAPYPMRPSHPLSLG